MDRLRGTAGAVAVLWLFVALLIFAVCCVFNKPPDPYVAKLMDKYDAVKRLNEERTKADTPPVQLIELNGPRWRAEQLSRRGRADGSPLYWHARLDGGLYAVEEVIVSVDHLRPSTEDRFWLGMDYALFEKRGVLLNPCYNYVALESAYYRPHGLRFYVIWMVGKWVNWTSPPYYSGGRFTAEGYAAPEMKPVAIAVRHMGKMRLCRYLDPPAPCKDVPEFSNATVAVSKDLSNDMWHFKIDAPLRLDETGLYVFELIADDLRAGRKCVIMQYAVEK